MLKVTDLYFGYENRSILTGVTFELNRGELCGLFGPNGSGKTTLFKCLLKFLKYQQGSVNINGQNTTNLSCEEMAKLVAYVPQEHKPSFPYLVKEVVLMGRTPYINGFFGISSSDKKKALDALDILEIDDLADMPYNNLSGGQRQLVLMARAVAQETGLMFLDEPTSALDFSNQIKIWRILQIIAETGVTILACSHDPNQVSWFCDKIVLINEGSILAQGQTNEAMTEPLLNQIYRGTCAIRDAGGVNVIIPRELILHKKRSRH